MVFILKLKLHTTNMNNGLSFPGLPVLFITERASSRAAIFKFAILGAVAAFTMASDKAATAQIIVNFKPIKRIFFILPFLFSQNQISAAW